MEKKVKLPRNYHAVNAHMRKAGAMKHRNTPRGGATNSFTDLLEEMLEEWGVDLDILEEVCDGITTGSI